MSSIVAESWTWYSLTWFVVILRMISQILLRGSIKRLRADDALILFAMMTDTVLIAGINIISHTDSNLIDPSDHTILTQDSINERVFGSKMVLIVEQMQILTVWTVKTCLLILYYRLTMSLSANFAVKAVAVYVAVGFVVMEVLYFAVWCRPFSGYWEVPPSDPQCATATNHLITNACFNISSDIMIILIPIPTLLKTKWPLRKKIILCCIFSLGGFTILSAALNKYYSFTQPYGSQWTFWYIRESSTAIIVANIPLTWTLVRRIFSVGSFNSSHTHDSNRAGRSSQCRDMEGKTLVHDRTDTTKEDRTGSQGTDGSSSQRTDGTGSQGTDATI